MKSKDQQLLEEAYIQINEQEFSMYSNFKKNIADKLSTNSNSIGERIADMFKKGMLEFCIWYRKKGVEALKKANGEQKTKLENTIIQIDKFIAALKDQLGESQKAINEVSEQTVVDSASSLQKKYVHIDLYEQKATLITAEDFNDYKIGLKGRKKTGIVTYGCEEYIILAIEC